MNKVLKLIAILTLIAMAMTTAGFALAEEDTWELSDDELIAETPDEYDEEQSDLFADSEGLVGEFDLELGDEGDIVEEEIFYDMPVEEDGEWTCLWCGITLAHKHEAPWHAAKECPFNPFK